MTSFTDFGLAEPLCRALAEENYHTPTPIQEQTIPTAMTGRDIIGIAQTGTGKTAAFALPILHRLQADPKRPERKASRVLVLSPTRELSGQIEASFNTYGRHQRVSTALAIGGVPMGKQVRTVMNGVDVMVATPGRLLDLVQSNAFKLSHVEVLVLDEADRMLDMGFINDIRKIVAKLPKDRQTLFFSATMPKAIADLAAFMLRDPARVAVTPVASTAERIAQRVIHVNRYSKPLVLAEVLKGEADIDRTLVFTRTKHGADKVVRSLERAGIPSAAIHGNKSQGQRERVLAAFRTGEIKTLVATDIAARGIDVDGITHVVNYDLPNIPETYVHRIGRTARAGAEGIAISLCDGEERPFLRDIEKLIRMTIPSTADRRQAPPGAQQADGERQPRGENRGRPQGQKRPQRGRPGEAAQGRGGRGGHDRSDRAPQEHVARQDRPHQDRPHQDRTRHEGDARPAHQGRPGRPQRNGQQDHQGRQGGPERQDRQGRPQGRPQQGRPQQGEQRDGGSIAAVAFMQRGPRPERASDRRPSR